MKGFVLRIPRAGFSPDVRVDVACGNTLLTDSTHELRGFASGIEVVQLADQRKILLTTTRAAQLACLGPDVPPWRIMDGSFAVAVLSLDSGAVSFGADAIGTSAVFWRTTADAWWIASEYSFLLETVDHPTLDSDAVTETLLHRGVTRLGSTPVVEVREVPQGEWWTVRRRAARPVVTRWQPNFDSSLRTIEQATERADQVLERAVRAALPENQTSWVQCSGGLDSSLVTSYAARISKADPTTAVRPYSVISSVNVQSDESDFQRIALEAVGMDTNAHDVIDIDQFPDYVTESDAYPWAPTDTTLRGNFVGEKTRLAQAHEIAVSVTGHGGDQLFGKIERPWWIHGELRQREWKQLALNIWNYPAGGKFSLISVVRDHVLRAPSRTTFVPGWFRRTAATQIASHDEAWLDRVFSMDMEPTQAFQLGILRCVPLAHCHPVPPELHPLLDANVVELFVGFPWRWKCTALERRVLQRRLLARVFPPSLSARRTKGNPAKYLLSAFHHARDRIRPLFDGRELAELGIVDSKQFRLCCEQYGEGLNNQHGGAVPITLAMEAWLRKQRTARPPHPHRDSIRQLAAPLNYRPAAPREAREHPSRTP